MKNIFVQFIRPYFVPLAATLGAVVLWRTYYCSAPRWWPAVMLAIGGGYYYFYFRRRRRAETKGI